MGPKPAVAEPVRRKWRGIEPDARTAERRERLVNAAIDLLGTEGAAGTTVRAVCAKAKLHSRYFYESFEDIDALLVAVFDTVAGNVLTELAAAVEAAPDDPHERLNAAVHSAVRIVNDDPRRLRVIAIEAIGNEKLNRRRVEMLHTLARMIEQDAYRTFGAPVPGERIGALAARFLVGGLAEMMMAWADGELEGDIEELAEGAMQLVLAFTEATLTLAATREKQRRRKVTATARA